MNGRNGNFDSKECVTNTRDASPKGFSLFDVPVAKHVACVCVTTQTRKLRLNYIDGANPSLIYVSPYQAVADVMIHTIMFDKSIDDGLKDKLSISEVELWLNAVIVPKLSSSCTLIMSEELSRKPFYLEQWIANLPSTTNILALD